MRAKKLTEKDKKEIRKLRALFPHEITVQVQRSEDGGFCAEILVFAGCRTEADSFSELIEMINDAARTFLEVPERYISYVPTYLPTVETAQHLDAYPAPSRDQKLTLLIPRAGAPR
ncbi:MAG: hypothetical protein AAB652_00110 [Patescibacteria group bacterium]